MDKKSKSARQIKEDNVVALEDKLARAKTITFTDYQGLSANQINDLRNKITAVGGELLIEKNTLLKIALKNTSYKLEDENLLTGPTAAIFAYDDELAALKEAAESNKAIGVPVFKFGFFGKDFINSQTVEKLSKIPSRNILEAKLVGSISTPLYGIVGVLGANLRNLVYALNAIKNQKGAAI